MSLRSLFSLLFAAVLLAACGNNHDIRTRIDGDWHRQTLENDHLGHWLTALPTANGFFNTAVTRDWQVLDPQPGDLVGQTRGIYVMAVGHKLTGKPAYLEQVRLGTDFLLRHFRDPLHGGWYEAVGPDGKPTNDNKRLYSQAFAIFALAHAYRATQDKRYLDAALQTWSEIRLRYADAHGGYEKGVQGVITAISPEGEIKRQRGWWQQAEALRALMHHAAIRSRSDLWGM